MEFLFIASAHFMALLSPGPDFFLIVQTSLRLSRLYALALCCGIAAANGVYIVIAIAGLEILRDNVVIVTFLKYLGGLYLIYIGISLLRAPKCDIENHGDSTFFLHRKSISTQFSLGFLSALLNPKNGIFYLSLFTVMVGESTSMMIRCLYGVWMCGVVLLWDMFVAMLLSNSRVRAVFGRGIYVIEKTTGVALAGFGLVLSLT